MDPRVNQKLVIGICLLLIILVGIFTYGYFNKSEEKKLTSNELKYNLEVYKGIDGFICPEGNEECKVSVLNISVENEFAKLIDITDDGNYILLDDNGLILYDVKNDTRKDINLNGYDEYKLGYDDHVGKVVGIIYYKDKYVNEQTELEEFKIKGFYNLQNNEKMYEGIYENLVLLNEKYLEGKIVVDSTEENYDIETSLLLTDEEKKISSVNGMCEDYGIISFANGYYVKERSGCIDVYNTSLYTSNLNLIVEDIEDNKWSYDENGYLYILDGNKVNQYNSEGVVVKTSNEYNQIEQVAKNYILYVDGGMLKITNENDVTLDVVPWYYGNSYDWSTSGYSEEESSININIYNSNDMLEMYRFDENTKEISKLEINE